MRTPTTFCVARSINGDPDDPPIVAPLLHVTYICAMLVALRPDSASQCDRRTDIQTLQTLSSSDFPSSRQQRKSPLPKRRLQSAADL